MEACKIFEMVRKEKDCESALTAKNSGAVRDLRIEMTREKGVCFNDRLVSCSSPCE